MSTLKVTNIKAADGTSALSIADSTGKVSLATDSDLALQGTGKVFAPNGIVFSSTELTTDDASTTTRTESSNVLDDYEEGTWTATVAAGSIASQNCTYTKIGRAVFLNGEINYGGTTEDPTFGGLPFTSANTNYPAIAFYSNGMEVSSGGPIQGFVLQNGTQILLYSWINNSLGSAKQSGGQLRFSGVYFV